jgi:antitoxin component of MazEF toxin-antitoxin module
MMQARVQKLGEDYIVRLPTQIVEELRLVDGSAIEVERATASTGSPALEIQRLSDDEARELFDKIEPLHRNTFAELAK